MEDRIREGFESLHMSEQCAEKIEKVMASRRPARRGWQTAVAAAAACLALTLVATCTPVGRAAVAGIIEAVESLMGPGYTVTERHEFENGSVIDEEGYNEETGQKYIASYWDGSFPTWLEAGEDGLWFVGNGERMEISGLIDRETPFTYEYAANGIVYHLAVGGEYDPARLADIQAGRRTELGFGWCAWMSKTKPMDLNGAVEWIGGYSKGYCDQQGTEHPWVIAAKEDMGIPWK